MYKKKGWIGVDFDGTLAHYNKWEGNFHCGEPIPAMIDIVKQLIADGYEVKIMTARVASDRIDSHIFECRWAIQEWCEKHIGQKLDVVSEKDMSMIALFDDRAVAVEKNTGKILGGSFQL